MIGIYGYRNKSNGKWYIGQSINITKRKWEHLSQPSNSSPFDLLLQKEGKDAFDFIILEECEREELDEKEKHWIEHYNSIEDGYNIREGGVSMRGEDNPAAKLTEEQVLSIVYDLENTNMNNKEIGKKYKVHSSLIDSINRCKIWNHVHGKTGNIRNAALAKREHPHTALSGENNPTSLYTEEQILRIIDKIINTKTSLAQIAREENVKDSLVYDINRCKTWKYLHKYKHNIRIESKKGGDAK